MGIIPAMELGKLLIIIGVVFIGIGVLVLAAGHLPWLGKLPGDFSLKRGSFQLYFPLMTCVIISIVLTILFNIFKK